ncbi:hypothetical protein INR49_015742 [Caranx melampygus]|nr:hypothetical protein INR49_015742 [Caranx melampygus]
MSESPQKDLTSERCWRWLISADFYLNPQPGSTEKEAEPVSVSGRVHSENGGPFYLVLKGFKPAPPLLNG